MSRLILLIAVAAVIYLLVKSFRRGLPPQTREREVEDMVRCLQCGVHVPKGESVPDEGRHFCCVAHRDSYRQHA